MRGRPKLWTGSYYSKYTMFRPVLGRRPPKPEMLHNYATPILQTKLLHLFLRRRALLRPRSLRTRYTRQTSSASKDGQVSFTYSDQQRVPLALDTSGSAPLPVSGASQDIYERWTVSAIGGELSPITAHERTVRRTSACTSGESA